MKRWALQFLRGCGAFAVARAMSANQARVLMYHNFCDDRRPHAHHVSQSALRRQLEHLRRFFHIVPLQQLLAQLHSGKPLDVHSVALTVDDGRRNCYSLLFPLLRQMKIPATVFVVSSFIRGEDWIWTDKVLWLSEQPSRPEELSPKHIDSLFATLNRMRPEARDAAIRAMAEQMGVPIPKAPPSQYAPCRWDELREMADSGLVEIGSHTVTHPILASISDEESWQELTISRQQIEQGLKGPVNSFCFPNGKPEDYRLTQLKQVKEAGYRSAVLAHYGMVHSETDPYSVPRIGISGELDSLLFSKYVDGAEHYQAMLRRALHRKERSNRFHTLSPSAT
jgi:peptidoglycan/xylan/chitin deacetylase (PgdA/CDA1 family)